VISLPAGKYLSAAAGNCPQGIDITPYRAAHADAEHVAEQGIPRVSAGKLLRSAGNIARVWMPF
jgi:hypothetical protein